jgi:uncharacterized membrane protein YeaQ/YmgE (transglycosylase-associated protein family)
VIMVIIITIVTGIVLGFATSARTPTDGIEDLSRNIVVGMAGAFVGLQVASRIFNSAETGASAIVLSIASMLGAAVLLLIVNTIRRA